MPAAAPSGDEDEHRNGRPRAGREQHARVGRPEQTREGPPRQALNVVPAGPGRVIVHAAAVKARVYGEELAPTREEAGAEDRDGGKEHNSRAEDADHDRVVAS
ncbi:hypothetical protein rosag_11440 [Roseisolibacter agri]|uniref:Uncharacterized protein n=1 Tax=Roseisolibacter agri TaxID=2014610 RepID=A0AA37Q7X1_9BACT|nr:hypothetical protein rosag_11440 [Roseisolibacter agri]